MITSFRFKIILWYTAIVLATLIVFRLVSIQLIANALYEDLDNSLRSEVQWMKQLIASYKTRDLPDEEIRSEINLRSRLSPRKEFIEVFDVGGNEYFRTANLTDTTSLRSLQFENFTPVTHKNFQNLKIRLLVERDSMYKVLIAYPLTDIEIAIDEIVSSMLFLIPVTITVLVLGGFFLLTRFMAPIRELNRFIDHVIELPIEEDTPEIALRSKDEMGQLARRIAGIMNKMRGSMRQVLGFSSLASHELRTPLAIIRNELEHSLRAKTSPAVLRTTMVSVYDEILRLSKIVDELLSLSTMQGGTFTSEPKQVYLDPVLREFNDEAAMLCRSKNVTFTLGHNPKVLVEIDVDRMRQVLFNLLDNAIKHTPSGGWISLDVHAEGKYIVIDFTDSGRGISQEDLPFIFDAFHKAITPGFGQTSGIGLGLTLVRWIIESHHGTISVKSRVGHGTTFTIVLPLTMHAAQIQSLFSKN